jgi:2-polyprenyl-3-methyl-5-hydroxy-6-metoxy-1,4-benzoquinol methylase
VESELDLVQVRVRLVEMGHGRRAMPILDEAVDQVLAASKDDGGFELDDLLRALETRGHAEVAGWVRSAVDSLVVEARAEEHGALVLNVSVTPDAPLRPEGAASTGYRDLADLRLQVAHAFEGPPQARRARYAPLSGIVRPGDRVLDIGCGDGSFLELAREQGGEGFGMDLDPDKVAQTRAKGFQVLQGRVQDVDWGETRFDVVSLIHIVEHIPPGEVTEVLDRAVRSLSEAGRLLIVTPNIEHPVVQANFWLDITHVRPYPQLLLTTFLATLGFPFFQSGTMAQGLETWGYGFRRAEDRLHG